MNDKQLDNLVGHISEFKIKEIDLSGNNIYSSRSFKSIISSKKLRKLIVTRNQLNINEIRNILKYIKNSSHIRYIDLSSNALGLHSLVIIKKLLYCLILKTNSLKTIIKGNYYNGYAHDHCKGILEKELFELLENNPCLENIYLIDSAFEFVDVDRLYQSMVKIFDPRTCSNLKEFHISYFCDQRREHSVEEKFKIFENFKNERMNSELWREYDINVEPAAANRERAIKIEIISRNCDNRKINFSATKYFTNKPK